MSEKKDQFNSRFGLIAAALGMAIGAGNIWRFPRLAGQYGGSFLIPWIIFLFLWSIPLLIVEFSIGKNIRLGVVGSIKKIAGKNYTWMGIFISVCTTAILFYYSVVTGWSMKFFLLSLSGDLLKLDYGVYWTQYTSSVYQPLFFHVISALIASAVIYKGVTNGIEKFSKIIVPALYLLLIAAAVRAVTLPGASEGLYYYFHFSWSDLSNYKVWLDGLSQSAWSTGAGWGLLLTYAVYAQKEVNIIENSIYTGVGNNIASIVSGLAIIPAVFALSASTEAAQAALASGNQGLAFITIPQIFSKMSGGAIFSIVFFLALFFAALSSMIAMLELAVRVLIDFGVERKKSVAVIFVLIVIAGAPSAVSMDFFDNQDWVWGIGLLISGFFFTIIASKLNQQQFPINKESLMFKLFFYFLLPFEFLAMFVWWLWQSVQWYPQNWWNPFETLSLGSCLLQWAVLIIISVLFMKKANELLEKRG